ncbi:MAG TPA: hypothetical protein VF541_07705 [Longimicrobium sp.]|jgi:hypothetical protein
MPIPRLRNLPLYLAAALAIAAPVEAQTSTPPAGTVAPAPAAEVLPSDFLRRRRAGRGYFATREQISRRHPATTQAVFAAASGVRLVPDDAGGMRVQMTQRMPTRNSRDLPSTFSENRGVSPSMGHTGEDEDDRTPPPAGTARTNEGAIRETGSGEECRVQYYRNGVRYLPDRESQVSRDIPVAEVQAVEIYRNRNETPTEFRGAGAECGVIVIWTASPAAGA